MTVLGVKKERMFWFLLVVTALLRCGIFTLRTTLSEAMKSTHTRHARFISRSSSPDLCFAGVQRRLESNE